MDKKALRKATEDSTEPTPGYLFRDIAQNTFLDHNTQSKILQYLVDLLKPNCTANVLAKALKMIKHLCENGHPDFQKEMQRHSDTLKQFASYRGNPDPKFADALNEKVRENAKGAIDACFSHRRDVSKPGGLAGHGSDTTAQKEEGKSFMTGISSAVAGWGGGGNNQQKDPHMAPMPQTNKWAEHQARGGGAVLSENSIVKDMKTGFKTGFGLWQEQPKTQQERMHEALSQGSSFQPPTDFTFGAQPEPTPSAGGSGGDWKFVAEGGSSSSAAPVDVRKVTAVERDVTKLCKFTNTPQRVELNAFASAMDLLVDTDQGSYTDIAAALDQNLSQKLPWQHRLNALTAIEHLLKSKQNEEVKEYFLENPEDIQRNLHVVQSSVKERAQKVIRCLGLTERGAQSSASGTMQAQPLQAATNAGGFTWTAPVPLQPPAEPAASDAGPELDFSGLNVKGEQGARQGGGGLKDKTKLKKRTNTLIAKESPAPASGFAPSNGNGADAWGTGGNDAWGTGGGFEGGFSAQTTEQPSPPPPKAQQFALDDLFGDGPLPPQPAAAPAPAPAYTQQPVPPPASNASGGYDSQPMAPPEAEALHQTRSRGSSVSSHASNATAAAMQANQQMLQQMSQQMTMLNQQMAAAMAPGQPPLDPAQMQAFSQQQQQIMQMINMLQQQQQQLMHHGGSAAPPQPSQGVPYMAPPGQPGQLANYRSPPKNAAQHGPDAFDFVAEEMAKMAVKH